MQLGHPLDAWAQGAGLGKQTRIEARQLAVAVVGSQPEGWQQVTCSLLLLIHCQQLLCCLLLHALDARMQLRAS